MVVRFADELTKLFDKTSPEELHTAPPALVLARGDFASFQVVVYCERACETEFSFPEGFEIWRENFAEIGGVRVADALLPLSAARAALFEGINAFWVRVNTKEDAQAGTGDAVFSVGSETFSLPLHVCDFSAEGGVRCETNTGVSKWDLCRKLGLSWENYTAGDEETVACVDEAYRRFYEFLLSFGFSPSTMPYPLGDERAEQYLNDERVTSFVLPWNAEEQTLKEWASLLKEHPAWAKKAMFYPVDEPMTFAHLNALKERAEHLRSVFPEAIVVTPLHRDLQVDETTDAFRFLEGITNLWCPKAALFSSYIYTDEQREKYLPIGERMRARKALGERLWWYICCEPANPYANVHMDLPLLEARVLFWQQVQEDVDGFLYWSSTYWRNTEDEFACAPHYLMGAAKIYGDGVLCYMGENGEPLPSVRLMALAAGMRDYSLLRRLQEKDGALCAEILGTVSQGVNKFLRETDVFSAARKKLYRALAE